jgi:hypothetical protein
MRLDRTNPGCTALTVIPVPSRRYGDEDVTAGGSDRLIDAGIAWGTVDEVARRVWAHMDVGADHVCVR